MQITIDIPSDTPPASPVHSPNDLGATYNPLTPPRRAGSPSVPARLITPLNIETPWNRQELRRIEKCFLGFLSGASYTLASLFFYEASQNSNTIEHISLRNAGIVFAFLGSYVATYLCTNRR